MTFPSIAATNSGNSGANATSHTVNLPSGIVSGNLLIAAVCFDGDPGAVTWPAGWVSLIATTTGLTAAIHMECRYRVADGTEGASITVTNPTSQGSAHVSYRITGQHTATAPEAATSVTADDTSPNPPSLNPAGWGTEDTLWIALYGWDDGTETNTAFPASYTLSQITNRWNNAGGTGIVFASRNNAVASEDPAVGTITGGTRWIASTLAVRPAGIIEADGSSSGTGTATGIGAARSTAVADAVNGVGTATGIGATKKTAVASAAGAGTATGVGVAVDPAVASAAGAGAATGVGQSTNQAVGDAAGAATVSGDGQSTNQAVGNAAGAATVSGEANSANQAVGDAAGAATVSGDANSTNQATGNAAGTGDTDCRGIGVERFSGMADGTSTCDSNGAAIKLVEGSSTGEATVSGDANSTNQADGNADGMSDAFAQSSVTELIEGNAFGIGTASGYSALVMESIAFSFNTANVLGIGQNARFIPVPEVRANDIVQIMAEMHGDPPIAPRATSDDIPFIVTHRPGQFGDPG